jgi:hypothetical protein
LGASFCRLVFFCTSLVVSALKYAMHSDVRDVTLISNSLRAIEQICKFARISLELQDPKLFQNACNDLLGLLKEPPYYQPGFDTGVLACLEVCVETVLAST